MQITENKCYGCGICAIQCPQNAINMISDVEGFLYPQIDEAKCIECKLCQSNCIANMENVVQKEIDNVYACVSKDEGILKESASGGVGYLLAKYILEQDGVVFGSAMNEFKVEHVKIERLEDLWKIQGTKYVQSDISEVLLELEEEAHKNRKILFTGTPCQIAAAKTLLKGYENLYCIELVCMGVPSPLVWEKHLAAKERELGNISKVKFRDKITGWKTSCLSYMVDDVKKYALTNMDAYMVGFGQCLYLRPSCHSCDFKGLKTVGDIKIGDFWGIENDDFFNAQNGVSLVIVENDKGKELFNKIQHKIEYKELSYKFALSHNPCIEISKTPSIYREEFFSELNTSDDVDVLITKYMIPSPDQKLRFWCQYPIVERLLRLKVDGIAIRPFFEKNGYDKVVVYGMGELGKLYVKLLLQENIQVQCIVDKNYTRFSKNFEGVPVVGPHDIHNYEYDCVIVSLIHIYNSVLETLLAQDVDINKIVSLGSII